MRWLMRSKIHNATVTEANLAYVGSITIDQDLLDKVGLWPGERVLVVSNTSGARLETYVIAGERGSGEICMNGAAAHLIGEGDLLQQVLHPLHRTHHVAGGRVGHGRDEAVDAEVHGGLLAGAGRRRRVSRPAR